MNLGTSFALALAALAALVALARVLRPGSTLIDRVVGLDLVLTSVIVGVGVLAARTRSGIFLDLFVVTGLLGFVSTIAAARYVERRGQSEGAP